MMRYDDPEYFELSPGQCAFTYYCNTCGRHLQWKEELNKCIEKHRREHRSIKTLTGDED